MDENGMNQEEWRSLKDTFVGMIPNYDRINSKITFGLDERWRKRIARESFGKDAVLEIGSGTGTLAVKLKAKKVYCLDPIPEMHEAAIKKIPKSDLNRYEFIVGSAEAIPLEDGCVDAVFCAFSFRDFFDKIRGLNEIYRVLKNNGNLIILDIAKHDGFYGDLIHFYIKKIAPGISGGRKEMKHLAETYNAFYPPEYYAGVMKNVGFKKIKIKFLNLKTIFVLNAVKIK